MSKEKLIAILKEQHKRIPIEAYQRGIDYAIRAIEAHTQQSEPKDNDVEGLVNLSLKEYPNGYVGNSRCREAFIKGYNHNTAELERLKKVNEGLVDAAEKVIHVHMVSAIPYRLMSSIDELEQAIENAKTKE